MNKAFECKHLLLNITVFYTCNGGRFLLRTFCESRKFSELLYKNVFWKVTYDSGVFKTQKYLKAFTLYMFESILNTHLFKVSINLLLIMLKFSRRQSIIESLEKLRNLLNWYIFQLYCDTKSKKSCCRPALSFSW